MYKKIIFSCLAGILAYGLWLSADFTQIAAGVAIFLFGMLSLEQGFKAFTGGLLEKILKNTTNTLSKSLIFGVVSTTLMQSSSLVSVITISFLSAGLLELMAGIGIVFGANIGTTTGAWLIAGFGLKVKISAYAMPMLVFGILLIFQKSKYLKGVGYILAGLGFLFLGIHYMKDGFEAFKDTIDLTQFSVTGYPGLFLFAGIGIAATVIMQSSHATLVLIITALAAGQISYENALALAIGANVGTTITAILGALGANEQGKRLAAAHLIFNMVTGLLAVIFMAQFVFAVDSVSEIVGIAPDDYTLKLAVFHTLFNLLGVIVMLPFASKLVVFLERTIRGTAKDVDAPVYLLKSALEFPDTAVEAVRNETLHVFENAFEIIARGICISPETVKQDVPVEQVVYDSVRANDYDMESVYENRIKVLFGEIVLFITKVDFNWEADQSGRIHWLRVANQKLVEAVKDTKHLRTNLVPGITSQNIHIRHLYNAMRVQIITILRELLEASKSGENSSELLSMDALKLLVIDNEKERQDQVANWLRKGSITPAMGTSVLNDSSYTLDVCKCLIEFGESLFVGKDKDTAFIQREVALLPREIDEIRSR
ncbi:MAG: sodium:phosphate symporter [Proteobacteria bacterium]|nr:MAG: sodium:phosphate symporter [Pseudomonadota bacterium]